MREWLPELILAAGIGQLLVLVAAALVPLRLRWKEEFAKLSPLHRQMYLVYGGYVVLAIAGLGLIAIVNADEIAAGGGLARALCAYLAIFWGIRLALQTVLDVREHLTVWWLKLGYHALTVVFVSLTLIYAAAALLPAD